uniref:Fibronectin type-III domain-containing protein n=1 Tax=Acrobeloides nanus TaxID=290746 RepID=A0A914BWZ1_9BILA
MKHRDLTPPQCEEGQCSAELLPPSFHMGASSSGRIPLRGSTAHGYYHSGCRLLLGSLFFLSILYNAYAAESGIRVRRETRSAESLLTVEWEGIQSGDHPDSSIRGFIVEYRAEKETQWHVHSGVIPYKGPNHQYRVQIPRLPTGISYFVRIKVLGEKNEVLVETPEIRARNEIVSIKCDGDDITPPRDIEVKKTSQFSVLLAWQPPECGSIGEYQIELRGLNDQKFDVHRQTVVQPSASITNLLPGTEYTVRIRAVDRAKTVGPWNEEVVTASSEGQQLESSEDVIVEYKSDTEIGLRWPPLDDERLQQYEVILIGFEGDNVERIERTRIPPHRISYMFSELSPTTDYEVGVVAYVDHEPRRVYRTSVQTAAQPAIVLDVEPQIVQEGETWTIHWKRPTGVSARKFIIEYKPRNETRWVRILEDREARDDEDSYSVSSAELVNAFSVRVIVVDDEYRAIARTKEALVGSGASSCQGLGGIPQDIHADGGFDSLTFTWKEPDCDQTESAIISYEYTYWNQDDEKIPETTSTATKPSVLIENLVPNAIYSFRVRSRLINGHSPWSEIVSGITSEKQEQENIYRLRIVLSPPKSYLVWSPLAEHRNNIANFKLSYKHSTAKEWTRIMKPPSFFKCPDNIADANDFCYDLRDLEYGKQYTSDNGEWTSHGSPLFFILVEAGDSTVPSKPNNLRITARDSSTIEIRWLPPVSSANIVSYEVSAEDTNTKNVLRESVPFSSFSHQIIGLSPYATYNVSVRALSDGNRYGEPASQLFSISGSTQQRGGCQNIRRAPTDVNLVRHSSDSVTLRWAYPSEPLECGLYFIISGTVDGAPIQQVVDGRSREHRFENNPALDWSLQIRAANRVGNGPQATAVRLNEGSNRDSNDAIGSFRVKRAICDPRTDFWCRTDDYKTDRGKESREALVSTPQVSQGRDGGIVVRWRSQGNGRGVFGYRVQFRTQDSGWNPYGQLVPYVGDDEDYSQTLTGLKTGIPYHVQIQALDRNSYVLYTSSDVPAQSSCTAPTSPPTHPTIDSPDARHVRIAWTPPPQSTWGCSSVEIELQVDEPRGRPAVRVDGRQTSHVLDSAPNEQWAVRIRTVNSAGQSPWTPAVSTRSATAGELLEGPFVTHVQGIPRLSWRTREGSDLIATFQVEWRSQTEPRWNTHRNSIPYAGWQRPYSLDLNDLPKGHSYQVRVKAIDHNRGTVFESPSITVQTTQQCSPPRRAPNSINVTPLGPTQIRLSWQPLAENEWNCDRLWYVVKYSSPESQGFKNLTSGENQAIFDSKPHTQWNFEIQAANPAGSSPWSRAQTTQTLSTAPGPVSDLNAIPISPESLQLSWRPPQNPNGVITAYEITYQLISKGMCDNTPDRVNTVTSQQPGYTITGLNPHSKYRIGVAARTTIAGERVSKEVQTDQSVPTAAPAYVRVDNPADSTAELSWHAPPCIHTNGDISEYEYEVTATDQFARVPKITETTRTTRVSLRSLIPGTKYQVKVRAYTSKGPGPWSNDVPFETRGARATQNAAPTNARVVPTGPTEAHLVWQTNPQNTGYYDKYRCQYAPAGTQQFQQQQFPAYSPCAQEAIRRQQPSTPQLQTHCGRIDQLQPQQTYDFQVGAQVRGGEWTAWSPPQRTRIESGPVQITAVHKISSTTTTLRFGWTIKPTDQLRCTAYRVTVVPKDRSSPPKTFTVDRNTFQYEADRLQPGTVYSVTVEAGMGERYSPGVTVDMSTDADRPSMGVTVDMSTDADRPSMVETAPRVIEEKATSVTIAWDVPQPISCSSFLVEYRLDNGVWQQYDRRVPCDPGRRSYTSTVTNLPTNSVVDLRVVVVSPQNQHSPPSPEARARTKCSAPESPPQGLRLDAPSTNEVRVTWARPAKETWNCDQLTVEIGYRIGNEPERTVPVPGDKTDYVFPSEPNTRWVVRVRSSNQVGSSQWSGEQTITTRQGAPAAVRDLRLIPLSPNEMKVQWNAPLVQRGTIVGYDISYRLKHRLACPEEEPRDVTRSCCLDGPEETKEGATFQQPPSAPPLNLQLTYALERSLSFQWEPVDCSQRHGDILNYEYEILGQDDWAKLERQIANTSDTRITIDGLTPFTKYVMRVKAYNSIGGGPNTENLDVMTAKADAPLPPQDLVVAQEGIDFFLVSWLPPYPPYGPHDKYKLRYQLLNANRWDEIEVDVDDERLECPAISPRFCFNITGLESGQQYRVQVAAHIEGGSYGPWSSMVIANTLQVLPDAVRAIELIDKSDHHLHIRWIPPLDPHGHITQYRIRVTSLAEPGAKPQTFSVDHPTLAYLIDNLNPETTYNISVSAGTKRGFGPEISTRYTTDVFEVPSVINAPIVTPEGAQILSVSWTGVSDPKNRIAGYIIELRTSDNAVWTESGGIVRHEPGKQRYNSRVTDLIPDTLYFVRIKVVDKGQRLSKASPEAQGRTGCAAPLSPPANVNINSPSSIQVRVKWQAPGKESWQCATIRYRIEYYNGSQPAKQVELPSSKLDNVFDSLPNTIWRVRVRVENDAGPSPWSNELTIKTAEDRPSAVVDLNARTTGPTTAEVTWREPDEPNGQITGYTLVYQLKSIGECGARIEKPITVHSKEERYDLKDLRPDATYEVHVIAHTNQEGQKSKTVTFTTEEDVPTGYPKNLRVTSVTSTRADLIWNELDCELRNGKITGYDYELQALNEWGNNISESVTTHRVSWNNLQPFTQYRARVSGKNNKGNGPFSEWVSFKTLAAAPPPPSDLRQEQALPHAVEISFVAPYPPNGVLDFYRIRHTPKDQFNYKEVRVAASELECSDSSKRDRLCYRVSNLEPEQDYEIQVSAHTEGGDWSDWSDPLQVRTEQQVIPVLERGLELEFTKPTSIGVKWEGLDAAQAEHVVGYVLDYKSEDDKWQEYNGIVRHRQRNNEYKVHVRNLHESTVYFFRLRVVGLNDKRGEPGPELKAKTNCGKPEEPPSNVQLESVDFETLKITWTNPDEETWKCDAVEFVIHYRNTTSEGTISVPGDGPSELILETIPGTKWEVKMRTQTVEEEKEPQHSKWSPTVRLTTITVPGEIFVKVTPTGPHTGEVTWSLPEDTKWDHGVDITYKLIKLGGCKQTEFEEAEPVTLEGVTDKTVVLDGLAAGSEYEVIVTPRRPPGLPDSIQTKKTIRKFKTEDSIPSGAPRNLKVDLKADVKLGFAWEPPECAEQNGEISQYEYEITGLDEWNEGKKEGVSPRTRAEVTDLMPGSLYSFRVRAFTSEGPGPWSEPVEARTTGSELGPPRELTAVQTRVTSIQLTWLPPYPERSVVVSYRLKYSPQGDDSHPVELVISGDALSCSGFKNPIITKDNLCTTVTGLQPSTTYRFAVQAQSSSGNWGPWTSDYFSTTRKDDGEPGGTLKLLSAGHDNIRVRWTPPAVISDNIDKYEVFIGVATELDQNPRRHETPGSQTEYHFQGLKPVTPYNITVQGLSEGTKLWFISAVFPTTDFAIPQLDWLTAPMDLRLIEKSETMMHVTWEPPEIWEPEKRELITHYRVTIAPVDIYTNKLGPAKNYTVPFDRNSIKWEDLTPETIYNITVQAGTDNGYGEMIWGTWSTLPIGKSHILRLKYRTPTTLTVEWEPVWGTNHRGYTLSAKTLASIYPNVRLNTIKTFNVDASETEFVIRDLDPATTYNVTLIPKEKQTDGAWGAYSTLPPGWFLPRNLKHCDKTNHATSMSWEPVDHDLATDYQVRYMRLKDTVWNEESQKRKQDLLCPKDPCNRLCYLVFNLVPNPAPKNPEEYYPDKYIFQVRAKVDGVWNRWKSAARLTVSEPQEIKENCCIVPPPYYVANIGSSGTTMDIEIAPAETKTNITRYYVVVDERDPPGDTNWTKLTDKVTANRLQIPYYVAASFNTETLTNKTTVHLGDGTVIGGYLNYPLIKGKKYNYEIYTKWMLNEGQPVIARLRDVRGWWARVPWYYFLLALLLFLLLLLVLIALCCCASRRRRREARYVNGQNVPLLAEDKSDIRADSRGKGDFEDGYTRGFREANRLGSAAEARRRMGDEFGARDDRFHEGYAKGLRDAGMTGMTKSMHDLAQRGSTGYSGGYMQGFRDGNSGIFGDRITDSLLRRLEEQYPGQDEFKKGYIDGFKEGASNKSRWEDSRRLQQSLTELTERLASIEKGKGDEIHSTRIYHVYNQHPEGIGFRSTGERLAHELEEATTESRRSTLRKHYTPGDYLKEAGEDGYNSLGRNRRSLSASALGRETVDLQRSRYHSGTSYISRASALERQGTDTYSKRYNYRSRSDVGSPRRYASQTLLDGARPGPTTPHNRRDALHSLQRELDSLSRSPDATRAGGYSSDTGYLDSRRRATGGYSSHDYDSYQSTANRSEYKSSAATAAAKGTTIAVGSTSAAHGAQASTSAGAKSSSQSQQEHQASVQEHQQQEGTQQSSSQSAGQQQKEAQSSHNWADDLIEIVHEPMGQTLDRMRRFSNSLSNVDKDDGAKEHFEEKYHRTYKEEHSSSGGPR